jgi:hypothetical protein
MAVVPPSGEASFESMVRGWNEAPQHAFSVQLSGHPKLYGSWQTMWAPNENDCNVKITGFGWASKYSIGHPNPATRRTFSSNEARAVRELVTTLFNDESARRNTFPFASKYGDPFLGGIEFQKNWIIIE